MSIAIAEVRHFVKNKMRTLLPARNMLLFSGTSVERRSGRSLQLLSVPQQGGVQPRDCSISLNNDATAIWNFENGYP
jgi:hypothetical protein